MRSTIKAFLRDRRGATIVEYCVILTVLSLVIVYAVQGYGNSMSAMFIRAADFINAH